MSQTGQHYANNLLLSYAQNLDANGVDRALAMGADPNAIGTDGRLEGWNALMKAVHNGPRAFDVAKKLVDAGAGTEYLSGGEVIHILMYAVNRCSAFPNYQLNAEPLIDLLVSAGADVNSQSQNNSTALFQTIYPYDGTISVSSVRALLKHGADPSAVALCTYVTDKDNLPQNVINYFAWLSNDRYSEQFSEAIRLVVDAGGQIDPPELSVRDHCCSALAAAAYKGNLELTRYFLEKGANTSVRIQGTPLIELISELATASPNNTARQSILEDLKKADRSAN